MADDELVDDVELRDDPRKRFALGVWSPNDIPRLRRHWRKVERDLVRIRLRNRELKRENAHLRRVVVEVMVRWYGAGGEARLPGPLGGSDSSAFFGALGHGLDDVDAGRGDTSGDG